MNNFYVYFYFKNDDLPYYVGKGSGNRAFEKHYVTVPENRDQIKFIYKNISENQAYAFEIFWISVFGRKNNGTGVLENITAGGRGSTGYKHTDESKNKISESLIGNKRAKGKNIGNQHGFKRGVSSWNTGVDMADDTKQKIAETKTKYIYQTPKGEFQIKREMLLAFPEYTVNQIERFTAGSLKGFSRKLK
jgi:hypothetical protein